MPRGLGRLPFFGRRPTPADRSPNDAPAFGRQLDPDAAPVGPPVLLPAAIFRQVLFDSTELVPVWATSRPAPPFHPAPPPASPAPPAPPRTRATGRRERAAAETSTPKRTRRAKAAADPSPPSSATPAPKPARTSTRKRRTDA